MTSDSSICEMTAFEIQTRDMHTSNPITGLSLRGGSQPLSKESRRKIEPKETPSCLIFLTYLLYLLQLEILAITLRKKATVNCRLFVSRAVHMRVSVMSCLIGWSLHTVQLCSTLLCAIVLWMLSGESSWQTGFSSVAVGLVGQKQKCWWSAAKIFNPTLIKGMYYWKKTKMNYSTCMCCPRCNVCSDWPLSLPLLATAYQLCDQTPPSHICQLSKGKKKTLWKLDASFPIQYPIHTWCCPSPPTLKHQLLSWSYVDEFN